MRGNINGCSRVAVCECVHVRVCVWMCRSRGDQLLLTSNGKSGRGVFCRRWRRAAGSGIGGGGGKGGASGMETKLGLN